MSAICGVFFLNEEARDSAASFMMPQINGYRFDKTVTYRETPVFFSCHMQCVTPESLNETLPYEEKASGLVITADAIIDNREELFTLLSIASDDRDMPDSLLILAAYKEWGKHCPEKLVGDFAFAIWDKKKGSLFCARDHVGRKSFYYCKTGDFFAFSTLMEPLCALKGVGWRLNDEYIADFLSIPSAVHELCDDITIYGGVLRLPPASAMSVAQGKTKMWRYWQIKRPKEIHFDKDEEYERAFLKVYAEAVRCRLRSHKKVGVMLSGGLDSGSAACLAAEELEKKGEKLYAYTQVPMKGYRDWLPKHKLADERAYVDEICEFAGNILPHYLASEGISPLDVIDEWLRIMEQPYKTIENGHWANAIFQMASDMGVCVLLNGQSGNATVSWGDGDAYLITLFKALRFKTFVRELRAYSRQRNISPDRYVRGMLISFLPYGLQKRRYKAKGGQDYIRLLSPINPEFFAAVNEDRRFRRYRFDPFYMVRRDSFKARTALLASPFLSHIGAFETKMSLAFGIEERDPTRDKRLIEFCLSLPEDQWVRDGQGRRLIRCAMKGHMPDKVRLNTTVRGNQGVDWVQRIIPVWEKTREEIAAIGETELEQKYLDIPKLKRLLDENRELAYDDTNMNGLSVLMRALVFSRFLRRFEAKTANKPRVRDWAGR